MFSATLLSYYPLKQVSIRQFLTTSFRSHQSGISPVPTFMFQTTGNIQQFCSVGLKISALQPLTADPVLSWEQRVTSVAVTSTGHHTVALLGTQHGTLKKVSTQLHGTSRRAIAVGCVSFG